MQLSCRIAGVRTCIRHASAAPLSNPCRIDVVGFVLLVACLSSRLVEAQSGDACNTDRTWSTVVGAGLGAAAAAIPATIVHRHDQTSSHRIVAVSVSAGALIGFVAAGRDHPCTSRLDSSHLTDSIVQQRSGHAGRGFVTGAAIGGVLGALGSTQLNIGCEEDPCHPVLGRVGATALFAGEGALVGVILGSLIGWAWPAGRH